MYNRVFLEQLAWGIIERVESNESTEVGTVVYLPHKHVIREDKGTTNLRVVFDASVKREGLVGQWKKSQKYLYLSTLWSSSLNKNMVFEIKKTRKQDYGLQVF